MLYTIVLSHNLVSGRYTTEAATERQAIKNVVFRELMRRNRSSTDIRPKALALANTIFDRRMYQVENVSAVLPPGVSYPTERQKVPPSTMPPEPEDNIEDDVRRGDQEYPENPDDEEPDEY